MGVIACVYVLMASFVHRVTELNVRQLSLASVMPLIENCSQNLIWRTIQCHFYCRHNDALCFLLFTQTDSNKFFSVSRLSRDFLGGLAAIFFAA